MIGWAASEAVVNYSKNIHLWPHYVSIIVPLRLYISIIVPKKFVVNFDLLGGLAC